MVLIDEVVLAVRREDSGANPLRQVEGEQLRAGNVQDAVAELKARRVEDEAILDVSPEGHRLEQATKSPFDPARREQVHADRLAVGIEARPARATLGGRPRWADSLLVDHPALNFSEWISGRPVGPGCHARSLHVPMQRAA